MQQGSGEGLAPHDIAEAVHAAARQRKQPEAGELQLLTRKWLLLLPQATAHQCASALCACIGLSGECIDAVWDPTWAAFMQLVQQGSGEGVVPRTFVLCCIQQGVVFREEGVCGAGQGKGNKP